MTSRPRRLFVGLALAALLACTGCGERVVKVKGKVLRGGQPLVVSEATYVTVSFVPDEATAIAAGTSSPQSARFDQKTGTYAVELKPGKYRTMVVVALPAAEGKAEPRRGNLPPGSAAPPKVNAPKPARSEKVYDLTKDQDLDIEVPG